MADHAPAGVEGPRQRVAQRAATVLVVAALFVPQVIGALYEGLERDLPNGFPVLSQVFLVLSLTAWFSLYSQQQQVSWVMDMVPGEKSGGVHG